MPSLDSTVPKVLTSVQLDSSDEKSEMFVKKLEEKDNQINELTLQLKALTVCVVFRHN